MQSSTSEVWIKLSMYRNKIYARMGVNDTVSTVLISLLYSYDSIINTKHKISFFYALEVQK